MRSLFTALALVAGSGTALATPLTLSYCITEVGEGTYQYQFTLTLDNHDGSWSPDQSFNWITFGDVEAADSNFPDFAGDLPAPLPFDDEGWSYSSGGHNGPTLLDFGVEFNFRGWVPLAVGESIAWSGRSNIRLAAGEMAWSNLIGTGVPANFEIATLLDSCDGGCAADFNGDGFVTGDDYDGYVGAFFEGDAAADFNGDGFVTGDDFDAFADHFEAGC